MIPIGKHPRARLEALRLMLGGRARPAAAGAMAALPTRAPPRRAVGLRVGRVSGGRPTDVLGLPQVSDGELSQALTMTLSAAGWLAPVEHAADGWVHLRLAELQQPRLGLRMNAQVALDFQLEDRFGALWWEERCRSQGTAGWRDALTAAGRLRMATESAVRHGLAQWLERLERLLESGDEGVGVSAEARAGVGAEASAGSGSGAEAAR